MKKGFLGFLKAGKQAMKKALPEIEDFDFDVDDFDLVIIGTPIWAGTIASPLRTFMNNNKGKFGKVAFFCTCSDKQARAFDELEKLTEVQPSAVLELNKKEMKIDYQEKIKVFVDKLKNN